MEKMLETQSSLLFVYRNKTTWEYVDKDGNLTEDIYEAIGYKDIEDAKEYLSTFDKPDEWYIVKKIVTMSIVGEPTEIKQFI